MEIRLDDDNDILAACYKNKNYKIIHGFVQNNRCLLVVSSNGVYVNNTYEDLYDSIVCADRYEWQKTAEELLFWYEKIIFIRDVRKQFYVTGINANISSIDNLIDWLSKETIGYKIVIAGSSAGGYLALAICNALSCEYVVTFGAQINLYIHNNVLTEYYYLSKYKDNIKYSKWYDLSDMLSENKVSILFFYSDKCEMDVNQLQCVKDNQKIIPIPINSSVHAQPLNRKALVVLLANIFEPVLWKFIDDYCNCAIDGNTKDCGELSGLLLERLEKFLPLDNILYNMLTGSKQKYNIVRDIELLRRIEDEDIIVYGVGKVGQIVVKYLSEFKKCFVFDKDVGKIANYKDKITESELKLLINKGTVVVLTVQDNRICGEIYKWLTDYLGCNSEQIIKYCQ